MDVSELYRAIALEKNRLDLEHPQGFMYVTSLRNFSKNSTAGTVTQVSNAIAARHFVDGTARESSNEERDAHVQRGILFSARMAAENEKRNPAMGRVLLMPDTRSTK